MFVFGETLEFRDYNILSNAGKQYLELEKIKTFIPTNSNEVLFYLRDFILKYRDFCQDNYCQAKSAAGNLTER